MENKQTLTLDTLGPVLGDRTEAPDLHSLDHSVFSRLYPVPSVRLLSQVMLPVRSISLPRRVFPGPPSCVALGPLWYCAQ